MKMKKSERRKRKTEKKKIFAVLFETLTEQKKRMKNSWKLSVLCKCEVERSASSHLMLWIFKFFTRFLIVYTVLIMEIEQLF